MDGGTIEAVMVIAVLAVAIVAAVEDVRSHRLRNVWSTTIVVLTIIGVGVISVLDETGYPLGALLLGAAAYGGIPLATHLRDPNDIGFGDVKYSAALGMFLGFLHGPVTIVWALVLAALVTLILSKVLRDEDGKVPFGPGFYIGALVLVIALA